MNIFWAYGSVTLIQSFCVVVYIINKQMSNDYLVRQTKHSCRSIPCVDEIQREMIDVSTSACALYVYVEDLIGSISHFGYFVVVNQIKEK